MYRNNNNHINKDRSSPNSGFGNGINNRTGTRITMNATSSSRQEQHQQRQSSDYDDEDDCYEQQDYVSPLHYNNHSNANISNNNSSYQVSHQQHSIPTSTITTTNNRNSNSSNNNNSNNSHQALSPSASATSGSSSSVSSSSPTSVFSSKSAPVIMNTCTSLLTNSLHNNDNSNNINNINNINSNINNISNDINNNINNPGNFFISNGNSSGSDESTTSTTDSSDRSAAVRRKLLLVGSGGSGGSGVNAGIIKSGSTGVSIKKLSKSKSNISSSGNILQKGINNKTSSIHSSSSSSFSSSEQKRMNDSIIGIARPHRANTETSFDTVEHVQQQHQHQQFPTEEDMFNGYSYHYHTDDNIATMDTTIVTIKKTQQQQHQLRLLQQQQQQQQQQNYYYSHQQSKKSMGSYATSTTTTPYQTGIPLVVLGFIIVGFMAVFTSEIITRNAVTLVESLELNQYDIDERIGIYEKDIRSLGNDIEDMVTTLRRQRRSGRNRQSNSGSDEDANSGSSMDDEEENFLGDDLKDNEQQQQRKEMNAHHPHEHYQHHRRRQQQHQQQLVELNELRDTLRYEAQQAIELKLEVQEMSRQAVLQKYGPGPHRLEFQLVFPEPSNGNNKMKLMKSSNNNNNNKQNNGPTKFVVELAPVELMPHSVHTFLEMVSYGLIDGYSFVLNAMHVVKALPLPYNYGISVADKAKSFTEHGLESVAFQEYTDNYPHKQYTIGFDGEGSPSFYINTEDNSDIHVGEPCFGKVISGFDTIRRLESSPTGIWFPMEQRIGIEHVRILY